MIEILIKREKKSIKRVEVRGHGGGKRGKDIVCAGVSAIAQTALSGLLHYGKDQVIWKSENGLLQFTVKSPGESQRKTIFDAILTAMLLGLKGIEREHPDKVSVTIEDD